MLKKIVLGGSDAIVVDSVTKGKIIDYLYSKLDLSKHRYIMINNIQKLKFLQENEHYVSPNFKGYNYLLIMVRINDNHYCVTIDRKKLSYHKDQLDMKTIFVNQITMNIPESLYDGTIFDGKLIQSNNNHIFLIQDCFYLNGKKMLDVEMKQKMNKINAILNDNFIKKDKGSYCPNFEFKLNTLYVYNELESLIKNLPTLTIGTNGLVFYPKHSGVTNLHIEKKNDKVDISSNNKEVIEQKSYHIIHNFVDFLKSRSYGYESNGSKTKMLWLSRTIIPDVYDISEIENGDKEGIALVPNLKTSHMCDNLVGEKPVKFNCIYSNKFKKWIPINVT
jgi:hypothetical protein